MVDQTSRFIIRSITITPDGTALEYVETDRDVWPSGLQHQHVVFIPRGDDYEDELDAIEEAAQAALIDALQDIQNTEPVRLSQLELKDPDELEDDDEDEEQDGRP